MVDHRRPARRPVDRHADQDRAVRPAAGPATGATASRRCRSSPPRRPGSASTPPTRRCASPSRYRTPVILLTDLFLANARASRGGSRRRRRCPPIDPAFAQRRRATAPPSCPTRATTTARARGRSPARPGLAHRIGGLEKQDGTGEISYDGANHARMTALRAAKVAGIEVPRRRGRRTTTAPSCSCSAGARARARCAPACAACAQRRAQGRHARTCTTSTRCPPTSARCCAPTRACWCPR